MIRYKRWRSISQRIKLIALEPRELLKRLRFYYAKIRKLNKINSAEIILYTEVATQCNNRCSFCAIDKIDRRGFIGKDIERKVKELIESNPDRLFRVYFHLVGEPLLYSGLEEYIKLLSLPNASLWVCTNGVLLDDAKICSLRGAGLLNIWFSMFYTNEKEYKKYTRSNNFLKAKNNLRNLLEKNELFEKIHIVTFSRNANEIKEMVKNKNNVTLETGRTKLVWDYDPGTEPNFICISIEGEVNFHWEDYNFATSIGNIRDLPAGTIMKECDKIIAQ